MAYDNLSCNRTMVYLHIMISHCGLLCMCTVNHRRHVSYFHPFSCIALCRQLLCKYILISLLMDSYVCSYLTCPGWRSPGSWPQSRPRPPMRQIRDRTMPEAILSCVCIFCSRKMVYFCINIYCVRRTIQWLMDKMASFLVNILQVLFDWSQCRIPV